MSRPYLTKLYADYYVIRVDGFDYKKMRKRFKAERKIARMIRSDKRTLGYNKGDISYSLVTRRKTV